jgi:hypothetical protein
MTAQPEAITAYDLPRNKATVVGVILGIGIGFANTYLDLVWPSTLEILAWLLAALVVVLFLHEGIHGLVGKITGYKPIFGVEPPLVFTTFNERISRNHLIAIAIAPLIILDIAAIVLYQTTPLRLFANLCFTVNTIGALGDIWIVSRLLKHDGSTWVQDTKSGVEIWAAAE